MNRHCPLCKGENISEGVDGTVAEYPRITRIYSCRACGFTWKVVEDPERQWTAKYIKTYEEK